MNDEQKPAEEAVAEALGVKGEEIELPGNVSKGAIMFETEDGDFGILPLTGTRTMSLDEMSLLAQRLVMRISAQMVARRVVQELQAAQAKTVERPRISLPFGRKP